MPVVARLAVAVVLACAMADVVAQSNVGTPVAIPLGQALDRLARDTGTPIIYSSDVVKPGMWAPYPPTDPDPEAALAEWLERWRLRALRRDGVFVIDHGETVTVTTGAIVGRVLDADGDPVAGIRLGVAGGGDAVTYPDGRFIISGVEPGRVRLHVLDRGREFVTPVFVEITARGIEFLQLTVRTSTYELHDIVIGPSLYALEREPVTGEVRVDAQDMESAPKLGGEVSRAIGYLPGVYQTGFSSRIHLRGGAPNETLYLFDGVRLHDPFHLRDYLAPFSVLDEKRLLSTTVNVGAFPAEFGDRMSGVVRFIPVTPSSGFSGEVDTDLFHTGLLLADSPADGSTGWLVSLRRGHLDLIADVIDSNAGRPTYLDSYATLTHETGAGLRLSVSYLGAHDRLLFDQVDTGDSGHAFYDNHYFWVRAAGSSGDDVDFDFTVSEARLETTREATTLRAAEFSGLLDDRQSADITSAAAKLTWRVSPELRFRGGVGYEWQDARYDHLSARTVLGPLGDFGANDDFVRAFNGGFSESAAHGFADLRMRLSRGVHADIGLRADHRSYPGDGGTLVGPRFGLAWRFSESGALRLSAGRYWQPMGIEELPVEDGVTTFFEPQRADTFVVGYEGGLGDSDRIRVEAFHKSVSDPWPRWELVLDPRSLVPELEADRVMIAPDSAEVQGAELSWVRVDGRGRRRHWATATFARATDRAGGRDIVRAWDHEWSLTAGARFEIGAWTATVVGKVRSGVPTSTLTLDTTAGSPKVVLAPIYNRRLPAAHGVDLRASRAWQDGRNRYEVHFGASNLYSGANPCCTVYSLETIAGVPELVRREDKWFGIVPNVGFSWQF